MHLQKQMVTIDLINDKTIIFMKLRKLTKKIILIGLLLDENYGEGSSRACSNGPRFMGYGLSLQKHKIAQATKARYFAINISR